MSARLPLNYVRALPKRPHETRTWVRPVNLLRDTDPAAVTALPLAGGWIRFHEIDVVMQDSQSVSVWRTTPDAYLAASADRLVAEAYLDRLTAKRPDFAGLAMHQPHLMGIVNATPDSFSDGGDHFTAEIALSAAQQMAADGASLLDIGGESTRPGAEPVAETEEKRRILPVISELAAAGHVVSADTRHPEVMKAATEAGAHILNDVSGFREAGAALAAADAARANPSLGFAIIMHMQGAPQTMQTNPDYGFAPLDIYDYLEGQIDHLVEAGVPRYHIAVDPGFGFGKTVQDNLEIIRWTSLLHGLGVPLLIGVSRKSSIAKLADAPEAKSRVPGTVALTVQALAGGAQMHRVHDVKAIKQALDVWWG